MSSVTNSKLKNMQRLDRTQIQKNKVEAINKLHTWLNKVVPQIQMEMAKGYKLKADNDFFKKDKERFQSLLNDKPFRAYYDKRRNSLELVADITYKTGEFSCEYYKQVIYLNHKYEPLNEITIEDYTNAAMRVKQIEEKIQELRSKKISIEIEYHLL